jgi:DNA polymerase III alpha subunit
MAFLHLEDGCGLLNVSKGPQIYEKHREMVKHSQFLLVEGRFERGGVVLKLVARGFRAMADQVAVQSRDYRSWEAAPHQGRCGPLPCSVLRGQNGARVDSGTRGRWRCLA